MDAKGMCLSQNTLAKTISLQRVDNVQHTEAKFDRHKPSGEALRLRRSRWSQEVYSSHEQQT